MKSIFSLLIAIGFLAFPSIVAAQTPIFTPASYAVYVHLNSQSVAANLTAETFNLTKSFGVEAAELVAPTLNLQGYYAGASYVPDLTKLFAKTTLAGNAPTLALVGEGGEVLNTTTGSATTKPSALVRVVFGFNLGSGVTVPINVGYGYLPGFGASNNGFLITAGLAKTFNLP